MWGWTLFHLVFIIRYTILAGSQSAQLKPLDDTVTDQLLYNSAELLEGGQLQKTNSTDPPIYSKPSLYPSCIPTSIPSTSEPTISLSPSTQPPSYFPTSYVKTDFPTNLPTKRYRNPTSLPSARPTRPSITPTTILPSSPSESPSVNTRTPSLAPSTATTPIGQIGKDWWYLLSAEVLLFSPVEGTFTSDDSQAIIDTLTSAFVFEYSDLLSVAESDSVTVAVISEDTYQEFPFDHVFDSRVSRSLSQHISLGENSQNSTAKFHLKTWCPSHAIEETLSSRLDELQANPDSILSILHEQNFRDVNAVEISAVKTSITTTPPPSDDSNLSPDRIIYIIIGTVIIFTIGAILISFCRQAALIKEELPLQHPLGEESSIDGDIMMTDFPAPPSKTSPSRLPTDTLSPLHNQVIRKERVDSLSPDELYHNPIYSLQRVPDSNNEEEEVFDFRFDRPKGRKVDEEDEEDEDDDDFLESGLHSQTFRMSSSQNSQQKKRNLGETLTSSLSSLFVGRSEPALTSKITRHPSARSSQQMSIHQNSHRNFRKNRVEEKIDYESLVL